MHRHDTRRLPPAESEAPRRGGRRRGLAAGTVTVLSVGALVLSGAAAGAAASPAGGTASYYVDCGARSNGDGSMAFPWNSTASVDGHGAYVAGDHILFRRGTTCSGRIAPTGSGVADNPIVIGAYGSGAKPTIDGGGTPDATGTVMLRNEHDWTVQDLHLTNKTSPTTATYRAGVLLMNVSGGRLANMTVQRLAVDSVDSNPAAVTHSPRDFGGIAVQTMGSSGDGFDNLRILHNSVQRTGRSGIAVLNNEYPVGFDTNVRIGYDSVRSARGDSIFLIGVKGGRIDHSLSAGGNDFWPCPQCTGAHNGMGPATANAGIWTGRSQHVRIDHNEVYGEHRLGGDGEGLDVDKSAQDVTVDANYVHDNQGGGLLICNAAEVDVRFNVFENNTRAEVVFTTSVASRNIHIYNNTFYVARSVDADSVVRRKKGHGAKGTRFFNNIVYSYGHSTYRWQGPVKSSSNTFVGHHAPTEPKGPGTSHADPGLRAAGHGGNGFHTAVAYRVKTVGRALRGAAIPTSATIDFFGKKVNTKHPFRGAAAG